MKNKVHSTPLAKVKYQNELARWPCQINEIMSSHKTLKRSWVVLEQVPVLATRVYSLRPSESSYACFLGCHGVGGDLDSHGCFHER